MSQSHAKNVISTHKWEYQLNHMPASLACKITATKFVAKVHKVVNTTACIHRRSCDRCSLIGTARILELAHGMLPIVFRRNFYVMARETRVRTSLLVQYRVDCITHGDHLVTTR